MKPSVEQMTSLTPLQKEIEVKRRVKEKLKKCIVIDEVRAWRILVETVIDFKETRIGAEIFWDRQLLHVLRKLIICDWKVRKKIVVYISQVQTQETESNDTINGVHIETGVVVIHWKVWLWQDWYFVKQEFQKLPTFLLHLVFLNELK